MKVKRQQLNHFALSGIVAGLLLSTVPAEAYIGPGAGLSLLGALWALLVAIAAAVMFLVLWPFRQAMRRRAAQRKAATAADVPSASDATHGASEVSTR